ncbi:MAG: phosphate signaling complex protein PhoU [Lachnospiraceae bacterium]|nr:phosphate signaling complex protein PhoU [Lachnospiraceae bacterium]
MSPRTVFEHELTELREDLKKMCFGVEAAYNNLFQAAGAQDKEGVKAVLELDSAINDMEKKIEYRCLSLITRQHPIARDLRTVSASLKVVTDIKRVGDHVVDMAELLLRMQMKDLAVISSHMPEMIEVTKKMFCDAVAVFLRRNKEEAEHVIAGDDKVDELFNKVKEDLVMLLRTENSDVDDCVDVLMLAKYLEKIGDHAVNVAEWEIFQETGDMCNTRLL